MVAVSKDESSKASITERAEQHDSSSTSSSNNDDSSSD